MIGESHELIRGNTAFAGMDQGKSWKAGTRFEPGTFQI
jgi:hypothetical protein